MGYNGSGIWANLYNWVNDAANGLAISSSRMNNQDVDFSNGFNNTITRDGQGKPSAAIDWNGQNLTGVANFSAATMGGPYATASEVWAASIANKTLNPDVIGDAVAWVTLTASGGIFTPDMSLGLNFVITLTANSTLGNITNPIYGRGGKIVVIENATGGYTLSKPGTNYWYGPGGYPTIDTTANAISTLDYTAYDATHNWIYAARPMSNV